MSQIVKSVLQLMLFTRFSYYFFFFKKIVLNNFFWAKKRYDVDIWTYIARFLDGKSLLKLALTSKWFHDVIMHDCVWKFACLRDLQVPDPRHVSFNWTKIYATAFGIDEIPLVLPF